MTNSQRLLGTLGFDKMTEGGAVLETFFPWDLTVDRWCTEGLPAEFGSKFLYPEVSERARKYLYDGMTKPVYAYERYLGFDGVLRMAFRIPFKSFDERVEGETDEYVIKRDEDGWLRKYWKTGALVQEIRPVVACRADWEALKLQVLAELTEYCTDENILRVYGAYVQGHVEGSWSIRFRMSGFFWTPRELLGIEEHMLAFYDEPELLADINQFVTDTYIRYLDKIFDILKPEVVLLEEDLSGSNGPMLSPGSFDQFIAPYYRQLFPFMKKKGVKNIFVDTDGDFNLLIPRFIACGVDGFLPMDVNAGMDILAVREKFPALKFIGAFNKLKIAEGKAAIDAEFERLMPVIRQGGYVPGSDHQVAPSTPLLLYCYYIGRLREAMRHAGHRG